MSRIHIQNQLLGMHIFSMLFLSLKITCLGEESGVLEVCCIREDEAYFHIL
jgi:hypothetical protein